MVQVNGDHEPLIQTAHQEAAEREQVEAIAAQVSGSVGQPLDSSGRTTSIGSQSPIHSDPPPSYTPHTPTVGGAGGNIVSTPPLSPVTPPPANVSSPTSPTSPYPGVFFNSPLNSPLSPTGPMSDKMREALGIYLWEFNFSPLLVNLL